jgi:hypothetical protein
MKQMLKNGQLILYNIDDLYGLLFRIGYYILLCTRILVRTQIFKIIKIVR